MSVKEDNCAVKIAVRERPFSRNQESTSVVSCHSPNILVVDERAFNFDHVLGPKITQQEIFESLVKPLVVKVKKGFNCTALAYGQTGTGKSYTMGLNANTFEDEHDGIVPRALREILCCPSLEAESVERELSASFIEIYNERVFDLLGENSTEPIFAKGCKYTGGIRKPLKSTEDCYDILQQGNKNRHVRPTNMNSQSSRSHAIFTIHMRSKQNECATSSCLNLVDLAGSESVRRTGHQGVALSEGVNINQGLLCIGKVLQAMAVGNKVIPYRDSVLSSVLQDSLNSNSYLTLLACISPCREDLSETLSTLRFAQSAKQLRPTPQINAILTEIRKNKAKTPYKLSAVKPVPTPSKRPYSSVAAVKNNTFCTPSKIKRLEPSKFNQSEMGLTPKEKQKAQMGIIRPLVAARPTAAVNLFNSQNIRESLLEHSLDSRASLMSLNLSSSTAFDGSNRSGVSGISPIVRKCLAEMESAMENKIFKMMETLKTANSQLVEPNTPVSLHHANDVMPNTLRQELKSIMQEVLLDNTIAKNAVAVPSTSAMECNVSPINQNVKCQLFATSSPVFKVPDEPAKSRKTLNMPLEMDIENEQDLTSEITVRNRTAVRRSRRITLLHNKTNTILEQSGSNASVRRSERISMQICFNDSLSATYKRRSGSRKSLNNRRKSLRQSKAAENAEPNGVEHKEKSVKKHAAHLKSADSLNNTVIAGYFSGAEVAEKKSKKSNLVKHRAGVLKLLNTGTIKELQLLPQIGPKTAFQIITQRTLKGKFRNIPAVAKLPVWRGTSWERFSKANMLV